MMQRSIVCALVFAATAGAQDRTMPPDAPGTDPLPKTGTPKAGSNTPPGDYGRSPSNGGGSFRPGRAPHSANDGESAPEQRSGNKSVPAA